MATELSPRDLVIALRGAFEAPDWSVYLAGRISCTLGIDQTWSWWSGTNEHEWFDFFTAIIGPRLGEKHAQREWERLISFWTEHRRDDLPELVGVWKKKTEKLWRGGISTTTFLDADYPSGLEETDEPPTVLWSTQPLSRIVPRRLAVIGSRNMTPYGAKATREFVTELAGIHGLGIVSGCARGIDWVAHDSAVKAQGQTIGVLGCGIDKMAYYCRELNHDPHVIWISEFSPGSGAEKWRFPFRNQLIAALSQGVLVIEGGPQSGTLITARAGVEMNREVMVLSAGRHNKNTEVLQKLSAKATARTVVTVENILDCLEIPRRRGRRATPVLSLAENETERQFLQQLNARGGRALTAALTAPDCIDEETWENTRFELEARGVIIERLGTCELAGMIQS
jgi:DNA processing protein